MFRRRRAAAGGASGLGNRKSRAAVFWMAGLTAAIVMTGGIVLALRAHHSDHVASAVASGSGAHRRGAQTTAALPLRLVRPEAPPPASRRRLNNNVPLAVTNCDFPKLSLIVT